MLHGSDLAASRAAVAAVNHALVSAAWARARLQPYADRTVHARAVPFTLALTIIMVALASYTGWSPRQYTAYF